MRYIAAEDVAKAKEMDRLTYLRNYEPQELVHVCSMMLAQFQISLLQQMPSSSKKLIRSFLQKYEWVLL